MGLFWKVCLLVLAVSKFARSVENSHLTNILFETVRTENNLATCLVSIIRHPDLNFIVNIGIRIETKSALTRREFMDTVEGLRVLGDRVAVNQGSGVKESYDIHVWFYFIDSVESLELLNKCQREVEVEKYDRSAERQNYLIMLPANIPSLEGILKQIFQLCWKSLILNVNVLVEDRGGIVTLYTYFPFTETSCRDTTPSIHNRFLNGYFEVNKTIFPPKTSNLWQCPVRSILCALPILVVYGQDGISGLTVDTIASLAKLMNFTFEIIICPVRGGEVYSNGTTTGIFKMLNYELGDLAIGVGTPSRYNYFTASSEIFFLRVVAVIKRSKRYSPLEILLFPFDTYTWITLSVLTVGKWIGQLLYRRMSNHSVSPSEVFRRFCVAVWLLSTLVISSSYEGSIFKFLHNRPSRAPPNGIDDAIDQGYQFIVSHFTKIVARQIPELRDNIIEFGDYDRESFQYFDEFEGKYGTIVWEAVVTSFINPKRYNEYILMPEPVIVHFGYIYTRKFSYLNAEISRRLQQLNAHGHLLKIRKKYVIEPKVQKKKDREPTSMSFQQLTGPFQLLVILIVISVCIFLLEQLSRYNRRLRTILEFFQSNF